MNNIVYTYYEPIYTSDSKRLSEQNLIDICSKSWELNGWNLIVLNYNDAKKHSFYDEYKSIIKHLPSINPAGYDYHCYMRWLAMSQIGGGLMIDYDVVNVSCKTDNVLFDKQKLLSIFQNHVPCVVYGSSAQYLEACRMFCKLEQYSILEQGAKHTSDMIMISLGFHNNIHCNKIKYVVDYPNYAELVHCSSRFCVENNKTKAEAMSDILGRTIANE